MLFPLLPSTTSPSVPAAAGLAVRDRRHRRGRGTRRGHPPEAEHRAAPQPRLRVTSSLVTRASVAFHRLPPSQCRAARRRPASRNRDAANHHGQHGCTIRAPPPPSAAHASGSSRGSRRASSRKGSGPYTCSIRSCARGSDRNVFPAAWALRGSNPRPPACKAGALPAELSAPDFRAVTSCAGCCTRQACHTARATYSDDAPGGRPLPEIRPLAVPRSCAFPRTPPC